MRKVTIALAIAAAVLLAAGIALAANGYQIRRFVVGGGGGRLHAASYTLDGTVGQAVAGEAGSATHQLCSGFWCEDMVAKQRVYLPLVMRSN
jgi:hypothetical protein